MEGVRVRRAGKRQLGLRGSGRRVGEAGKDAGVEARRWRRVTVRTISRIHGQKERIGQRGGLRTGQSSAVGLKIREKRMEGKQRIGR